jgi:hypothetical protein
MAADRAKISVPLTLNPDDQSGGERVGLRAQLRRRSSPVGFFMAVSSYPAGLTLLSVRTRI